MTVQLEARGMMALFEERRMRTGFLQRQFSTKPGSTGQNVDELSWDVVRFRDRIAGTKDKCTGPSINVRDPWTTKTTTFPTYNEAVAINECDLVNRRPGEDPFAAARVSTLARFASEMSLSLVEIDEMINRALELQASQIFQTGQLALPGDVPFANDYLPKATHFPTAGTAWSDAVNCTPLDDIEDLCKVIYTDSRVRPLRLVFGATALREFRNSDQVKENADISRYELVNIAPDLQGRGASLYGVISVGQYRLEMWTYDDFHEPFGGGAAVPYVDDGKVIVLPDRNEPNVGLTAAGVSVKKLLPPDPRVAGPLGGFMNLPMQSENGIPYTPSLWTDDRGSTIYAGVETRALLIPQGIDTFGCLTT